MTLPATTSRPPSALADVQMIVTEAPESDIDKIEYQKPAYVAVVLVMAITGIAVFFPMLITNSVLGMKEQLVPVVPVPLARCPDTCRVSLVESIPENLTYVPGSPSHLSVFTAWMHLLRAANESIDIASSYWSLRGDDIIHDPSDWQGEEIFKGLMHAGKERGIKVRIAQTIPEQGQRNLDTELLAKQGAADVRSLNFTRWFGAGILHTKMWLVDRKHFYVGSANLDWRSLTQVKELGVLVTDCDCLANDMQKIFDVYWYMGGPHGSRVPEHWPQVYATAYNLRTPLTLRLNHTPSAVYLASSPAPFCPAGRSTDLDAILNVIEKAQRFVHIAVMDYFPLTIYTYPKRFWPAIDDALRKASLERGVQVRLMGSLWNHTRPAMRNFLRSLHALSGAMHADFQVKLFKVPSFTEAQRRIPFARVNHNKYMVTDNAAYIGTSNWSGDYFLYTGGIGFVVNQTRYYGNENSSSVQQQLADIFERDWNSQYALPVSNV